MGQGTCFCKVPTDHSLLCSIMKEEGKGGMHLSKTCEHPSSAALASAVRAPHPTTSDIPLQSQNRSLASVQLLLRLTHRMPTVALCLALKRRAPFGLPEFAC